MAGIIVEKHKYTNFTMIPNEFIDNYMPLATPAFVPVYIYLLRNHMNPLDTEQIAERFCMLESDVIKAFKYWSSQGLIEYSHCGDNIIIALKEKVEKTENIEKLEEKPKQEILESLKPEEKINAADLFEFAEHTLGKMLSDKDLNTLYNFHEWLNLPIDVIMYLLEYCVSKGQRHMNYIERTALDWNEKTITTLDAAKQYVNIFNKDYRQIMNALGFSGRNPNPKEIEFMDEWLKTWEIPIELVLEACDKTILAIGKGQFKYANKILNDWHIENVKTMDDVKRFDEKFREKFVNQSQTETKNQSRKEMPKRKNRFANYEQHVKDYDEIEKLESEYLLNKLKGEVSE